MNKVERKYDALKYLPHKPLQDFTNGSIIYSGSGDALYLVVSGRVKITTSSTPEALVRIVPPDGLFGLYALVGETALERAIAMGRTAVMSWKRTEIEARIEKEPELGLALIEEAVLAD